MFTHERGVVMDNLKEKMALAQQLKAQGLSPELIQGELDKWDAAQEEVSQAQSQAQVAARLQGAASIPGMDIQDNALNAMNAKAITLGTYSQDSSDAPPVLVKASKEEWAKTLRAYKVKL